MNLIKQSLPLLSAVHEAKQTHGVQHDCIRELQFPRSTVHIPAHRVYTAEQVELRAHDLREIEAQALIPDSEADRRSSLH